MKPREIRFRGNPTVPGAGTLGQIDARAGIIYGCSAIQVGLALGHDCMIDQITVQQTVDAINAAPDGVKCRFTHPGMCDDGTASLVGRVRNGRLSDDGTKALCDLYIGNYAANAPSAGNLRDYVLKRAQEDPGSFGMSIAALMTFSWMIYPGPANDPLANTDDAEPEGQPDMSITDYQPASAQMSAGGDPSADAPTLDDDGNPLAPTELPAMDDDGRPVAKPEGASTDLPVARIKKLTAVDVVGEPAANRDGLFSANTPSALADAAFHTIDDYAKRTGASVERLFLFARRYFAARGVDLTKPPAAEHAPHHQAAGNPAPATPQKGNAMLKPEELKALTAKHPDHAGLIVAQFADGKGVAEIEAAIITATKDAEAAKSAAQLAAITGKLEQFAQRVEKLDADHKAALQAKDDQIAKLSADLSKAEKVAKLGAGAPPVIGGMETDEDSDELSDAALEKRWASDPALRKNFMAGKDPDAKSVFFAMVRGDAQFAAARDGRGGPSTVKHIDPTVFRGEGE